MSAEGGFETEDAGKIDSKRFLDAVLALIIAIGFGTIVSMLLGKLMTFPFYIGAMLVGAVIRNVADVAQEGASDGGDRRSRRFLSVRIPGTCHDRHEVMAAGRAGSSVSSYVSGSDRSHVLIR